MRLRIVSSKSEIESLESNERMFHMAFRPSNVDFLNLIKKCPRVRVIQVPHSYRKTMSKAMTTFLEMEGVELLEGDVWGHRKDLDVYFTVQDDAIDEIRTMRKKGMAFEDLAEEVQKKNRLGSDLIKYIAKTKATA